MAAITPAVAADVAVQPAVATASGPGKNRKRRFLDGIYPYSYIAPSVGFMAIASFLPIAFTIYISLTNYGLITYTKSGNPVGHVLHFGFVGLTNYINVFNGSGVLGIGDFLDLLLWTVLFAAITTTLAFTGGLFLANLLNNENMRERSVYRTVLIIPWALPGAIATLAWSRGILSIPLGLSNQIETFLHVPISSQPEWLLDPGWVRVALFLVGFWFGFPFMMTACLGALQSISPEVLQAAEIDGANSVQKFVRVTLPLLRSAVLPLVISTFAYNLNNFGAVYLLTAGGPPSGNPNYGYTDTLTTVVYKLANTQHYYYLACTFGVLIFIIIGSFSFINMKLSGAFEQVT